MSMSADLRDRARAAGVAGGSVYRDERPQGSELPAVVLQVASDPRQATYDDDAPLRETRTQADCMAGSRGDADALAETLLAAVLPGGQQGGTRFSRSFVAASRTYSDRPTVGGTIFVTSLDLMVWHQPAA